MSCFEVFLFLDLADVVICNEVELAMLLGRAVIAGQEAVAGPLPCLRVGRKLLFSLEAVEAHLARRAATERAGQAAVPPGPAG